MDKPIANTEAEQALLAAGLYDIDALTQALDIVKPDMFYNPRHKVIYKAMIDLSTDGGAVDLVTISEKLRNEGSLDRAGGAVYLAQLANTFESSNVKHYADIVREKYSRRRMFAAAQRVKELAGLEGGDWEQQVAEAESIILEATQGQASSVALWGDVIGNRWDELYQSRFNPDVVGLQTRFSDLDSALGGLQPQDLIIIAARPSQGKTTLAQNIMERVAEQGKSVYFASLEMGRKAIADRALSSASGIDTYLLRSRKLTNSQWDVGSKVVSDLARLKIYIDDDGMASSMEIRAKARRIKAEGGLSLVVVDFLQLMNEPQVAGQSRNEVVGMTTRRMKAMAKELDVPVLLLSQLNRAVENRADKVPTLADLRESGEIEQVADVVMFIHTPDPTKPTRDIIIAKHRNGPVGKVSLYFDKQHVKFETVERRYADHVVGR